MTTNNTFGFSIFTNSFLEPINMGVNLIYKSWVGEGGAVSIQSSTCENWVCYVFSDSFEVFIFADAWSQVYINVVFWWHFDSVYLHFAAL